MVGQKGQARRMISEYEIYRDQCLIVIVLQIKMYFFIINKVDVLAKKGSMSIMLFYIKIDLSRNNFELFSYYLDENILLVIVKTD